MKKRFYRDKVFNDIFGDIQEFSGKINPEKLPAVVYHLSLTPLSQIFQASEGILDQLESVLESMKREGVSDDLMNDMVAVITNYQNCLMSSYDQIKVELDNVIDQIQLLKSTLDTDNNGDIDSFS